MNVWRARLAALVVPLVWAACNGTLEFDQHAQQAATGDDGGDDAEAGVPPAQVPCEVCTQHGMSCMGDPSSCVECVEDAECGGAGHQHCDPTLHRCTECGPNGGCDRGRVCDGWSHTCVRSCAPNIDPDEDCNGSGLICDMDRSLCVECQSDADCVGSPNGSHCPPGGSRCAACSIDADCTSSAHLCDPLTFTCVGCADSRDCAAGQVCDPAAHSCVAF